MWDCFDNKVFGFACRFQYGIFFSNMGNFLFVDISNVVVDILTLSLDDSLLSLNVKVGYFKNRLFL